MSELIRRKKVIPVQAQRVEPMPDTIHIPGSSIPAPPMPPTPGVTQNIIYVTVPPGHAPPQAAPVDQREVHFHTTNIYHAPKWSRRSGTSFLGTLGFVLGGVAAAATYSPQVLPLARPIALTGLASAVAGLLGALLFSRVGRLMPLVGIIACGTAYGLWLKANGQLPVKLSDLPQIDLNIMPSPMVPSTVNPPGNKSLAANPSPTGGTLLHDNSIFGDGSSGWAKSSASPAVQASPSATPMPAIGIATATTNLESARLAAAQKMGLDYTAAKAAAAQAESSYQDANIAGNPDLVSLSQQRLQADSQLNIVENKLRTDPAVSSAEIALKAANK